MAGKMGEVEVGQTEEENYRREILRILEQHSPSTRSATEQKSSADVKLVESGI